MINYSSINHLKCKYDTINIFSTSQKLKKNMKKIVQLIRSSIKKYLEFWSEGKDLKKVLKNHKLFIWIIRWINHFKIELFKRELNLKELLNQDENWTLFENYFEILLFLFKKTNNKTTV